MYMIREVAKSYGESIVLRSINCTFEAGAISVVLGPSGCGKSTLLRLMSFLEMPDAGDVTLEAAGRVFKSTDAPLSPWPIVTCVFQRQFLWPHLTLRQNILLPLNSRGRDSYQTANRVIELFDMESFVDRFPNEVSGGQAQRAALARAFALEPSFILLDEAHSYLDLEQQGALNTHLGILRRRGIGLVVVTHSLHFASNLADKIIVLDDGEVVEEGSRDLLRAPRSAFLRRLDYQAEV